MNNRYQRKRDVVSQLINVVFGVPNVSDFINDNTGNVFSVRLETRSEVTTSVGFQFPFLLLTTTEGVPKCNPTVPLT